MRAAISLALALSIVPPSVAFRAATAAPQAPSPTIRQLTAEVQRDGTAAAERFWDRVAGGGAPIVEPANRPGHSIVTFVYPDADGILGVRLDSNLNALAIDGITTDFEALGAMERLPEAELWHLAYEVRNDIRVPYRFEVTDETGEADVVLDPNNDRVWEPEVEALRSSILELAGAPPQPWRPRAAEEGDWNEVELGVAEDPRKLWVYKPLEVDTSDGGHPLFLGLGAFGIGVGMRVDRMVDHLIEVGRIPPIVVALTDVRRESEGDRYLPTVVAVVDTILPYLRAHYPVGATGEDVVIGGTSRRGLISAIVALERPDAVANVLSLSGSFYWKPSDEVEYEWVARTAAGSALRPVRFYLAAGFLETVVTPGNRGHYMVATNRHLRDVLRARGYDLRYVEFNGVHSELNWQDWLAAGLEHFFGSTSR